MNDSTPICDFRGQPTGEPVDLDEAVPVHAGTAEPQPEAGVEEADLAPPPNEQVIDAIIDEPQPASRPPSIRSTMSSTSLRAPT